MSKVLERSPVRIVFFFMSECVCTLFQGFLFSLSLRPRTRFFNGFARRCFLLTWHPERPASLMHLLVSSVLLCAIMRTCFYFDFSTNCSRHLSCCRTSKQNLLNSIRSTRVSIGTHSMTCRRLNPPQQWCVVPNLQQGPRF